MEPIEAEEYKGYSIEIHYDQASGDPFEEWDQMGTMVLGGGVPVQAKYADRTARDYYGEDWGAIARLHLEGIAVGAIVPFSLEDYGSHGWSLNIGEPGMPDDNDNGFLYVTRDTLLKEYSVKIATRSAKERAAGVLTSELKVWAAWLNGAVYGYVIKDPDGVTVDSLWGLYGDEDGDTDYALSEAREMIDYYVGESEKAAQSKAWQQAQKHDLALVAGF